MTNKKSIWVFVFAFCLIVPSMFMLTACGNKHEHKFSAEWTTNETHHWHDATCEHTDEKESYGEHTVTTWTVKTEAGLHVDKVEQGTCSVCEKVMERTVPNTATHTYSATWSKNETQHWKESTCEGHTPVLKSEVADHDFGAWTEKTPVGIHQNKVEERKCTVCEYSEERTVANTEQHQYSNVWSKDETGHWHECSCGKKADNAEHSFGAWQVTTPANYGVKEVKTRKCSVCDFAEIQTGSALAPKTNNVTVETINLTYSGEKQSIDSLITADNSTGMVVEYEGTNGTTYAKSTIAPTNAGSYKYSITIPATSEWAKGEKTDNFEIKKYKVDCPDNFVTELSQGQTTTKLCEIDLTDKDDINLDEIELIYSNSTNPDGMGVGRIFVNRSSVKVAPAFENNVEVVIPASKQTIEWIVLDGSDAFSLLCTDTITAGSCYQGTIRHGFVKVGDKLTVLDYNDLTNRFVKVGVTVTQIEYLTNRYDTNKVYKTTSNATKGEIVKITFTKDNASDNIASVRNIVSAQDIGEINENASYKSKTIDLSFIGSEFRMLKVKINTNTKCKLTISDDENSKLLKVFNSTTGEEIILTENNFQVAEGTDVYVIIQQGTSNGTQQVKIEMVEYTFGA